VHPERRSLYVRYGLRFSFVTVSYAKVSTLEGRRNSCLFQRISLKVKKLRWASELAILGSGETGAARISTSRRMIPIPGTVKRAFLCPNWARGKPSEVEMTSRTIALMAVLATSCPAQVSAPKRESHLHHIFASHRDVNNLEARFDELKCALVLIEAGQKFGTGFYISSDGNVATASHVLADRTFSLAPDGKSINVNMALPRVLYLTKSNTERLEVPTTQVENNADAWVADVALIKTGNKTPCWLREVDDRQSRPGQSLITMGFPGLSFKTLTIYTGIMSARLKTNLPTMILTTGQPAVSTNDFIRVQMPISAGLSGAPIIDDENRAVGIVTNAGGWTRDLENLMMAFHGGAFQTPPPPPQDTQAPNTVTFNLNSMALTAELAGLFHDYASPGYGDAVPLRYLRKPPPQSQPSASHGH